MKYDFHYNFIKKNSIVELLFTDTDTLTFEIKSEYVYDEFYHTNKKVIGKMKDEYSGVIIDEFVGLKSKMHSIKK